jgi:sulfur-carrier protein
LSQQPPGLHHRDRQRYASSHTMGPTPVITIHVPGALRQYCAGAAQLSVAAHTVRSALEALERTQSTLYRNICDETGTIRRHLNVFVNSDNVRDLDGVDTMLAPGDEVTILPAVSGGEGPPGVKSQGRAPEVN